MNDISGLVSLKYVIMQVFDDMEISSPRSMRRYLNIARRGLVELQTNVIKDVTTKVLEIDSKTGTANIPNDYLYYAKIAVIRNGQMYPLVRNDKIPLVIDYECGEESNSNKDLKARSGPVGFLQGKLYNASGGYFRIQYRIDNGSRRIFFQGAMPEDKIHLEYVSTGIPSDGEVLIPRYVVDALKEYIHWQRIEYNPTVHPEEKLRRARSFYFKAKNVARVARPLILSEVMDAIHSASKTTPKR